MENLGVGVGVGVDVGVGVGGAWKLIRLFRTNLGA